MSQFGLFEPGPHTLVDDASGRIVYAPGVVASARAREWFEVLRAGIPWRAERRVMYERELDVPRLVASFRLSELENDAVADVAPVANAHGRTFTLADAPPQAQGRRAALDVLREAARVVSEHAGVAFTSIGLNHYRDGRDSVAPHNDRLGDLVVGQPIALLSLGATRRMTIRAKEPPRRALHIDLEAGSVLTMSYDTHLHYVHGIPKVRDDVGPRISVALRVRTLA